MLSNLFQLSVWKFSKQNCREMPIKILIIFSFSPEQLTLIIIEENCRLTHMDMRSNSKSPSFWLKMQVIEVIIHEYAHEMDYAHIKLDLIYQELPVKDWHLWQGFSWKNAKLVVYVALTLFSDLRSGSWQGQWAIDHLMFSESHKLYMDGMLLVRGMVRRMGIMNPS